MVGRNGETSTSAQDESRRGRDLGEDDVAETDPQGRYYRYRDVVGKGRFKQIYKAFDTQIGIDVAWSKISSATFNLSADQLQEVVRDMSKGLELDHPNIIKCFKCWEDAAEVPCINLITELFTSGNLRQYRNLHKHLDLKAMKRMARQILKGLDYLHAMATAPVAHGDLRCDKIYVNGHSGEIKIGDLGLATLLPYRWEAGVPPPETVMSPEADIFAFGLCMLELLTLRQLDPQHFNHLADCLADINDEEARAFVSKCLGPKESRPDAATLLDEPFVSTKKSTASSATAGGGGGGGGGDGSGGGGSASESLMSSLNASLRGAVHAALSELGEHRRSDDAGLGGMGGCSSGDGGDYGDGHGASTSQVAVGKLKGEDYNFELNGRVKEGKLYFRLLMTRMPREASHHIDHPDDLEPDLPLVRTIDFTFDPDEDTPDKVAVEIGNEFGLSSTDQEICASALREWLARESMWTENQQ